MWRVLIVYTWQSQLLLLYDEVPTASTISQLCGSNDNTILQRTVTKTKSTSWLNIYGVARRFYLDSVTWLWLVLFQIRTSFIAMPPKSKFSDVFELVLSNLILICMVLVSVYRGLFCDCNSVRVKTWWPNFVWLCVACLQQIVGSCEGSICLLYTL